MLWARYREQRQFLSVLAYVRFTVLLETKNIASSSQTELQSAAFAFKINICLVVSSQTCREQSNFPSIRPLLGSLFGSEHCFFYPSVAFEVKIKTLMKEFISQWKSLPPLTNIKSPLDLRYKAKMLFKKLHSTRNSLSGVHSYILTCWNATTKLTFFVVATRCFKSFINRVHN